MSVNCEPTLQNSAFFLQNAVISTPAQVQYLTTSVKPSNTPSKRLWTFTSQGTFIADQEVIPMTLDYSSSDIKCPIFNFSFERPLNGTLVIKNVSYSAKCKIVFIHNLFQPAVIRLEILVPSKVLREYYSKKVGYYFDFSIYDSAVPSVAATIDFTSEQLGPSSITSSTLSQTGLNYAFYPETTDTDNFYAKNILDLYNDWNGSYGEITTQGPTGGNFYFQYSNVSNYQLLYFSSTTYNFTYNFTAYQYGMTGPTGPIGPVYYATYQCSNGICAGTLPYAYISDFIYSWAPALFFGGGSTVSTVSYTYGTINDMQVFTEKFTISTSYSTSGNSITIFILGNNYDYKGVFPIFIYDTSSSSYTLSVSNTTSKNFTFELIGNPGNGVVSSNSETVNSETVNSTYTVTLTSESITLTPSS